MEAGATNAAGPLDASKVGHPWIFISLHLLLESTSSRETGAAETQAARRWQPLAEDQPNSLQKEKKRRKICIQDEALQLFMDQKACQRHPPDRKHRARPLSDCSHRIRWLTLKKTHDRFQSPIHSLEQDMEYKIFVRWSNLYRDLGWNHGAARELRRGFYPLKGPAVEILGTTMGSPRTLSKAKFILNGRPRNACHGREGVGFFPLP